ncbi:MAG TPA: hypothetical protein VNI79_07485 [Sphingomicrobium sp.]|nr:hypothetical protein [Sphingomicrobium sp.]
MVGAIRLLKSDKPNEVAAAVSAIERMAGVEWLANVAAKACLAEVLASTPAPRAAPPSHWFSMAQFCACHLDQLSDIERQFVIDMAHRNTRPSVKQEAWLGRIHADLNRMAA